MMLLVTVSLRKIEASWAGSRCRRARDRAWLVTDVQVVNQHLAVIGAHQADDHVEGGGLAGPVGAEQADDLAAVDAQTDVADHLALLVALGQVTGNEGGHYSLDSAGFLRGWITMSMRGRGVVTLPSWARPALTTWVRVS